MLNKWLASMLMCVCGVLVQTQASASIELEYSGMMGGSSAPVGVIDAGGNELNTPVGLIKFKEPGTNQTFEGFCIEPGVWVKPGPRWYDIQTFDSAFDVQRQSMIAKLYDDHYASAQSNAQVAAIFQLVLWEVLSDSYTAYDLQAGNFQVKSGTLLSLITAGSLWLNDLAGWYDTLGGALYESQKYQFMVLHSEDSQDQIIIVSEPGMLMLFGIGLLAGLGFMRRRTR